jgi:hypothetical protein
MCLSCGCKQPNESHGDDRNITQRDIEAAAQAAKMEPTQVVSNIQDGFETRQPQMAGTGSKQTNAQQTGNNQQKIEDRQGGYGAGGSRGPQ